MPPRDVEKVWSPPEESCAKEYSSPVLSPQARSIDSGVLSHSFSSMSTLPLHSGSPKGAGLEDEKAPWPTTKQRATPSRRTMAWRYAVVVTFLLCYYLLLRPADTICTSPKCLESCDVDSCTASYGSESAADSFDLDPKLDEDFTAQGLGYQTPSQRPLSRIQEGTGSKIPLEAHIMSKCPDAKDCLQKLILPAMEQISDKVDFNLSFIASVSEKSTEVDCKHGPGECIGNMLLLCAANLPFPPTNDDSLLPEVYPRTPIIRSLGFANCMLNGYSHIPNREFIHECAMEHGIDFDALNRCASQQDDDPDGGEQDGPMLSGLALLRESALRSDSLGIKTSCTVRLDESVWCVRDNGEWKDCARDAEGSNPRVLVDAVNKLWEERN
ncbi:Uncharacterized protein PECH_002125 [Penicillium ucsense]|uniref:Gamma interferon inducible lysosomal thiol reductase n=1 Tax=Penicillium ucsense TaxID=2839758 RepID=A0A8J8W4R0_9EURO|nr:Uncharacterized protein PECM_007187 [Penicillium ucsense]KAF7738080.1 Uncharacterized protein PECH_002125 [Penicillium ucsense]